MGRVLQDLQVVLRQRQGRRALRPRPPGQAARLADERLLQPAVGLRRRLLQGRGDGRAARLVRIRASRCSTPRRRSRRPTMYRRLASIAHPGSLGLGLGRARRRVLRRPARDGGQLARVRGRPTRARASRARSATPGCPRGPKRSASMYGGTGLGINATASEREQKAAWLFVNWATLEEDAARQPQERRRRRHADARLRLQAPRGPEGQAAAVGDAQHPHRGRRLRGLAAREHRAAPEDRRRGTSATRRSSPSSRRCSRASRGPTPACATPKRAS